MGTGTGAALEGYGLSGHEAEPREMRLSCFTQILCSPAAYKTRKILLARGQDRCYPPYSPGNSVCQLLLGYQQSLSEISTATIGLYKKQNEKSEMRNENSIKIF